MKRFNILRILLQAILIFLTCLIIAVIIKDAFNIDADYLSASATFFAAFTAFMLFNDWREQFKTELFERVKDRIHNLFNNATLEYDNLYYLVVADSGAPEKKDLIIKLNKYQYAIDALLTELDFYEKILNKYKPMDLQIICDPNIVKQFLTQSMNDLHPTYTPGQYNSFVNSIKAELITNRIVKFITEKKIFLNNDIQNIILKLIKDS